MKDLRRLTGEDITNHSASGCCDDAHHHCGYCGKFPLCCERCARHAEESETCGIEGEHWTPQPLYEMLRGDDDDCGNEGNDGLFRVVEGYGNSSREDEISQHTPAEASNKCQREEPDNVEPTPDGKHSPRRCEDGYTAEVEHVEDCFLRELHDG